MTKFIVHIGDGKCGSSSIQKGLYETRAKLREVGVIYETTTPHHGHFDLVSLIGKDMRGSSPAAAANAQGTIDQIRATLRPGSTVLLSAESFFNLRPANLIDILKLIDTDIEQIDLIAYVRTPHKMYLSLVQQIIKADSRFQMPDQYQRRIDTILETWKTNPAINSLTVRNFDRSHLIDDDVVPDFNRTLCDLIGRDDITLPRASVNTSLSAEQLVILQKYRGTFLKDHDGKAHQDSQKIITYFEALNALGFPGTKPALSETAVASLREANKDILEAVNSLFPTLVLSIPDNEMVTPRTEPWRTDGSVAQILKKVDPTILDITRKLVSRFERSVPRDGIMAIITGVRKLCKTHEIDPEPVLNKTLAFWHLMAFTKRSDMLKALLTQNNDIPEKDLIDTPKNDPSRMILYGKGDWLFLKADSNRVMEQIAGTYQLPADFQKRWEDLFDFRAEMARQIGYRYFFGIAPNKECVYSDQLPDGIAFTLQRPIQHVLDAALGRVSHRYYLDALMAARAKGEEMFITGDTHWNHVGAAVAFNEAMRALGLPVSSEDEFIRETREIKADLSIKLGKFCDATILTVRDPKFKLVEDNKVNNIGHRRVYENEDKTLPSCVYFRDSFASHQLEMFASKFSRITFLWQPNIDYDVVRKEAPDIVISQLVERFLVECPDDLNGPSHAENVRRKLL